MKKRLSAITAVLLLAGCAANTPAETTAETTTTTVSTTTAETTTTTSQTTAAAETTAEITAEEITAETAPAADYKELYSAFLTGLAENGRDDLLSPMFDLYDLDGDGVPELFFSPADYHAANAEIYAVSGGGTVQLIKTCGSWGEVQVSGNYLMDGFENMGAGSYNVYEKKGDELVKLLTLDFTEREIEAGSGVFTAEFSVNGEAVSEDEYKAAWQKYGEEWEDTGRRYALDKENIAKVFGEAPPELPYECKVLYRAVVTAFADSDEDGYACGKLAFDFYDLDSDGTPELFFSGGPSHQGWVNIYTVSGGEVKTLGEDLGSWGEVQVCGERLRSAWFGGGVNSESYYVKNGDSLDVLAALENNYFEPEEYFINGEEVTKEEYESEQLKYDAEWENIGRKYFVGEKELEQIFG